MSLLQRREPWLLRVLVVLTGVLLVDAAVRGRWHWLAATAVWLVLVGTLVAHGRRKAAQHHASGEAAAEWTPDRVAEVLQQSGGKHVAAVKAVRDADPRLSLVDADALVRRTRTGG